MNARIDPELADALGFAEEADAPVAAWSLDELDRNADLESLHWAQLRLQAE